MPRRLALLVFALLVSGRFTAAQQTDAQLTLDPLVVGPQTIGHIEFGAALFDVAGDAARDQRYRDLRSGPMVERFRYSKDQRTWFFDAGADHVGRRDQRYAAEYARPGTLKASFEWNQIPLFNSTVTRTPYTSPSPGVFRIDDALQQGIQAGAATLASLGPAATTFDLRSRREIGEFRFTLTPARDLDLTVHVNSTARKGAQQWGVGFGISSMVEVPAPLDHRTTDVGTSLEWASGRGTVRIGYDGSFFRNAVETLVVDNPLRLTDSATATSQARMSLWPSSTSNAVSTAGSIKLPGQSTATAYLSIGDWKQDADLIPFTINTAIAPIPLARSTAQADARITAMSYTVTSRPQRLVWLSGRFKRYDFDNRTPVFPIATYVTTDSSVATSVTGGTEPLGYLRDYFDADASFTPIPFTALRIGYSREEDTRTHRLFEKTIDNALRGTVDFTGNQYVSIRTVYEHSKRTGRGLDEEVLDDIGEQVSLRQFDISNRHRDRVSAIVQVTPVNWLGVTTSLAGGNDRRPDAEFGLKRYRNRVYAASVDVVPGDGTMFGASYGVEDYRTTQNSRQANPGPQFEDPTRNWSTDGSERVHTANVSADVLALVPGTEFRLSYDFSRSRARYVYVLPANTTLASVEQLPALFNELQHGAVEARYLLRPELSLGVVYWYDRYNVDDFALGETTLNRVDMTTSVLLLDNTYRPYRSHTIRLEMSYRW